MNRIRQVTLAAGALVALTGGMVAVEAGPAPVTVPAALSAKAVAVPKPDHVVIVMLENKRYDAVIGDAHVPWINSLAAGGANLTRFYGETHPSQPNYLALFSGSTQGVTDNNCPHDLGSRPNLGRQLLDAGYGFTGYSEDLPRAGFTGCAYKGYVRRHSPWVNFSNMPASANQPYTSFPNDFRKLPTVSLVIPNLCHDMHDCPKKQADAWLRKQFVPYIGWARTHNSLFVLTFDEDNRTDNNHIATIVAGAGVRPGQYSTKLNHYDLLRTLQQMYRLPPIGAAARHEGLPDIWAAG